MAGIGTPQSSAGILNFYDAQTNGPRLNPKIVIAAIAVFVVVIIVANHFLVAV